MHVASKQAAQPLAAKCEIKGLVKRYGGHMAVDDVSFSVEEGEFVVLLGPSGCGKTTTLRLIAGLEQPDSGVIAINGKTVSAPAQRVFVPPERRDIGMVFQSYAIWPHMTVFENVAYPLRVRRFGKADLGARVERVLNLVGLAGRASRPATALSGGQMQRVALARALVADPTLLLFDEPLSNLDLKLRESLRLELKDLQKRTGLTSIYVTHDQTEAVELADRIIVMNNGKVEQSGDPLELYLSPKTRFVAQFISSANIFEATVTDGPQAGTVRATTEGGRRFLADNKEKAAVGDRVDVVVHPEDCRLEMVAGSEEGHAVRILRRQFQGTSTRYTVDWGGQPFNVVALGTVDSLKEGMEARLHLPIERTRIIPKQPQ